MLQASYLTVFLAIKGGICRNRNLTLAPGGRFLEDGIIDFEITRMKNDSLPLAGNIRSTRTGSKTITACTL